MLDQNDRALLDELDDFVADVPWPAADVDVRDAEPVPLEDEAGANRLLRAAGAIKRRIARYAAVEADEVARIRAFTADRTAGLQARLEWVERSLQGWMLGQDAKVRTVKLPNGDLRRRPLRQRVWVVRDDADAVAEVAAVAPSVIKTVRTVSRETVTADLVVGDAVVGSVAPEPGYVVHTALAKRWDDDGELTLEPVPHVVFLVPEDGADTFGYTAR